jgi:hypothetical protein
LSFFLKPKYAYVRMLANVIKTGIAIILIPSETPGTSLSSIDIVRRLIIQMVIAITKIHISKKLTS